MNNNSYDVIIIGAGISGLVCGCYLAKAGMKVLIVEHHDKPGGYFTTFKRKGFLFDAAAHSFGNYRMGGLVRKVLTELGVDDFVKIIRFDPSDIVITPDFEISFWNEKESTINELSKIFPSEKKNIIKYFDFITAPDKSEFLKLKDKTFSALLHSFFENKKLLSSIALPVFGSGGVPPSLMHSFIASKIFSEFILDGGYYPDGCIQSLPNALDHIVKRNGGGILYKRLVKKILLNNDSIKGIKLDNEDTLISKYVVSACDMTQTFKTLLGAQIIGEQRIRHLRSLVPSMSSFILYIGIDKPFKGIPKSGANIWYLPHYDLDELYYQMEKCNFSKIAHLLWVSPNKKTIIASFNTPFITRVFWKKNKKIISQAFLKIIENYIPNLKKHISYFDAATPSTLYKYTLNYKGAAFAWAKIPSQAFDPIMRKTTSINGLYLTGHWTSISFGMPGSCYAGYDTAKRILRKEKLSFV